LVALAASAPLTELASGIDAVYLSGWGSLPPPFVERLEKARSLAEAVHQPLPFRLGELSVGVAPHGWGRYRFLLAHELGRIGLTTSAHLPAVRVQPAAALLHAVGPEETIAGFAGLLAAEGAELRYSVNRLDLFVDVQGWELHAADRERFVCRASESRTFAEGGAWRGFSFGSRRTRSFFGRLYDKTAEITHSGADWWPGVWGEHYDPARPVVRVELEVGRTALGEFGLDAPDGVLAGSGDLWRYGTGEWLTYRRPTADATRSRWPLAPEWRQVQQASLCHDPLGLTRVAAGRRAGTLRRIFPALAGYLAAFAVAVGTAQIEDTLVALDTQLRNDEIARRMTFPARIERRRMEGVVR
jgi:hypothetical protein